MNGTSITDEVGQAGKEGGLGSLGGDVSRIIFCTVENTHFKPQKKKKLITTPPFPLPFPSLPPPQIPSPSQRRPHLSQHLLQHPFGRDPVHQFHHRRQLAAVLHAALVFRPRDPDPVRVDLSRGESYQGRGGVF